MVACLMREFVRFFLSLSRFKSFSLARTWLRIESGRCFSSDYIYTLIEMSKRKKKERKQASRRTRKTRRELLLIVGTTRQPTTIYVKRERRVFFSFFFSSSRFFSLSLFPPRGRAHTHSSYRIIAAIECILKHVNRIHGLKWIWQDRKIRLENRLSFFFFFSSLSLPPSSPFSTHTQSYEASLHRAVIC